MARRQFRTSALVANHLFILIIDWRALPSVASFFVHSFCASATRSRRLIPENNLPQPPARISRRHFARQVALAAATIPAGLLGSSAVKIPASLPPQAPPPLTKELHTEIVAIRSAISYKYGGRLSKDQMDDIQQILQHNFVDVEKLRFYRLDNASQPAIVLRIFPPDPAASPAPTTHHPPSEDPARKPVASPPKD
jgi:hypothetical protein